MLKAVPTILLLIFVYFFLKATLFSPLEKVLRERDALTAGARKGAQASLAAAEAKQREYEEKFAAARAEVYKGQEETRRKWLEDQSEQVAAERTRMEAKVHAEKQQISSDAEEARRNLAEPSGELAAQIAETILSRKAGRTA